MFGLPDEVAACLFDMDGVVTKTAIVHAAAWKQMFDDFLRERAQGTGTEFVPFDPDHDYGAYVDGKPRLDGTRSFLESRGIELPEGSPDDPPGKATINGLSNRKNDLVLVKLEENGVQVYAVVFEDALAGVAAGHAGHFALVVGVDRVNQADALHEHGADVVVEDVADLLKKDGGAR
jgi:beta-phosphoglucomutase-like phosphatase (HAD superfamily)